MFFRVTDNSTERFGYNVKQHLWCTDHLHHAICSHLLNPIWLWL